MVACLLHAYLHATYINCTLSCSVAGSHGMAKKEHYDNRIVKYFTIGIACLACQLTLLKITTFL